MFKIYAGIGLILLLGFAFWYVHKQSYNSGVNAERAKWQSQVVKGAEKKVEADNVIIQEKVVWRDRAQKVREVIVDCQLPPEHISVLRESGIFRQ